MTDPIPVSQRHPTSADCDHNGGSWIYGTFHWTYSYWLPAGAMPRPGFNTTTTETP